MRQFGIPVQHKHECISEDGWAGARLDGFSRQMPPESARAGNRTEKSKDVTCNTGLPTFAFMATTQSATSDGSAIKQAPNRPTCTRSDGHPAFRD